MYFPPRIGLSLRRPNGSPPARERRDLCTRSRSWSPPTTCRTLRANCLRRLPLDNRPSGPTENSGDGTGSMLWLPRLCRSVACASAFAFAAPAAGPCSAGSIQSISAPGRRTSRTIRIRSRPDRPRQVSRVASGQRLPLVLIARPGPAWRVPAAPWHTTACNPLPAVKRVARIPQG
jgi:hypothetical protein